MRTSTAKKPTPAEAPPAAEKAPAKMKGLPPLIIPKTLGACADLYADLRQKRLAAEKVADEIGKQESQMREHLIQQMPNQEASSISGRKWKVTRQSRDTARVEDWDKFYAYIKRTGEFELLQRRPAEKAIAERWENKKKVPGVVPFPVVSLSVGKA